MRTVTALDILVVDDESTLRESSRRSFKREGPRVTWQSRTAARRSTARPASRFEWCCSTSRSARARAGYDVARALRERRAVVPIIMLTALDSEADVVLRGSRPAPTTT